MAQQTAAAKKQGKGEGKGYKSESTASTIDDHTNATADDKLADKVASMPFELLPCELALADLVRALGEAKTSKDSDVAVLGVLRAHPFIEVKGRPGGAAKLNLGETLGICTEEHFRMNIRAFNQWLKTPAGKPFAKEAGGPSDDGIYTLSTLLRRCMPRGLSRFTFSGVPEEDVLVRGFRKFTGLTAEDEDEDFGATNMSEEFYYTQEKQPARFAVTTKSNGENGKMSVRKVGGEVLMFAGSKNTCLVWRAGQDVAVVHPLMPGVPGPSIAAWAQRFWRGWEESTQKAFVESVGASGWTLMLEHNDSHHEHIFPIAEDFVEFVAILDSHGVPLPQQRAFAFFDAFHLPRVRCEQGLPMESLPDRLGVERAAVDREGAVLYLETEEGEAVGLLKVKSNFYVRARRTRQIFWNALVDPLLKGESIHDCDLDAPAKKTGGRRTGGIGWDAAEKRLLTGMKELRHIDGCAEHWEEWAQAAIGFVKWWRDKFEALSSDGERRELLRNAKDKFGSTYRDYCCDAKLAGGDN